MNTSTERIDGYKEAISGVQGFLAYPRQKKGQGKYFAIPLQKSAKDPSSRQLWLVYTMRARCCLPVCFRNLVTRHLSLELYAMGPDADLNHRSKWSGAQIVSKSIIGGKARSLKQQLSSPIIIGMRTGGLLSYWTHFLQITDFL